MGHISLPGIVGESYKSCRIAKTDMGLQLQAAIARWKAADCAAPFALCDNVQLGVSAHPVPVGNVDRRLQYIP